IKERSQTRRQNLDHQRAGNKRANAFERLISARNNKLGKDEGSEKGAVKAGAREDSQSKQMKKVKLKAADIYSDDSSSSGSSSSSSSEESTPVQPAAKDLTQVTTAEQLSRAILTRNQLESFLDRPNFEQTVVGCFVRVNVSVHADCSNRIYQILGLREGNEEYALGRKRTKQVLRLRFGAQEQYSLMDVVSNQSITKHEFSLWVAVCQRDMQSLPLLADINQKKLDVERAYEYSFTEGDVEQLIQTKVKSGQKLMRAACRKIHLLMERDRAIELNDVAQIQLLEQQIQEIDDKPRKHGESSQEQRTQVITSPCAPAPTKHLHEPMSTSFSKRSFTDRAPNSEEFELEQYMRRKYKKSAVVSRSR
ncbi:hypothetical protein KR200_011425, partial [Drosophila serrata]